MADIIQIRRDTAANWLSVNPILAQGELGVETDTEKMKIGDGISTWTALGYFITTQGSVAITGGTIDGTVIGGSSAAAGTFTTVTASGEITANGGIALGDNDKATFGASDDLQIYHDGSNSRLVDSGTGNFIIQAGQFRVNTADDSEAMIKADVDGAVSLYHSGDLKLATTATGIDVTGTVTADGLTVSNTGTGSTINVERTDGSAFSLSAGTYSILGTDDATNLYLKTNGAFRQLIASNGDISFYEDTGTTAKFFWDASAESLGIGTSSPTEELTVGSGGSNYIGIGGDGVNASGIRFYRGASTVDGLIEVDANEDMIISMDNTGALGTGQILFKVGNSERARLNSSGNLLVGKTTTAFATEGAVINNNGSFEVTKDGGATLFLNRKTSDGALATFYKDGSTVGSIASEGGDSLVIQSGTTSGSGLLFHPTGGNVNPARNGAKVDNAIDLGRSTHRFKDLYLSGGVYAGSYASFVQGGGNDLFITNSYASGDLVIDSGRRIIFKDSGSEAMRLDSSGNLLVGTTTAVNSGHTITKSNASTLCAFDNTNSTAPYGIQVRYSGLNPNNTVSNFYEAYSLAGGTTKYFEVRSNGGIANYQANNANLSDEREKKDIESLDSTWHCVESWDLVKFRYNHDDAETPQKYGVIAQQVEQHCPEIITEWNKGTAEEPEVRLAVKEQQMTWMAIKALQEAMTRIETLEAEVSALKTGA